MLSIERVKELLDDDTVTAEEAEQLRDASRAMAEILYEKWQAEQKGNYEK